MAHSLKILKTFIASENFDTESVLAMLKIDKFAEELCNERLISEIFANHDLLRNQQVVDYLRRLVDVRIDEYNTRSIDTLRSKISDRDYHRYEEIISHQKAPTPDMDISPGVPFPLKYFAFYPKQYKGTFHAEASVYAPKDGKSHENRILEYVVEPLSQYFSDAGCEFVAKNGKTLVIDYAFIVRCISPGNKIPLITNKGAMQYICTSLGFDQINIENTAHLSMIVLPSGENALKIDNYPSMKELVDSFNLKFEDNQARNIIAGRNADSDVTTTSDYIGVCYAKERDVILVPESFRVFACHTTDTFSGRIFEFTSEPSKLVDDVKAAVDASRGIATMEKIGTKFRITLNPLNDDARRTQNTKISISYKDSDITPANTFCKYVCDKLQAVGVNGQFKIIKPKAERGVPTFDLYFERSSGPQSYSLSGLEDKIFEFEREFGVILRELVSESKLIVNLATDSKEKYTAISSDPSGPIVSSGFSLMFIHMGLNESTGNTDSRTYLRMTNAIRAALLPIFLKNPSFVTIGLPKNLIDVIGGRVTKGSWDMGGNAMYKYTPTNFAFFDEWQSSATDSESSVYIYRSMNRFARCIFDFTEIVPHRVLNLSSERTKACNVMMYLVSFSKLSPPIISSDSDLPLCEPFLIEEGKHLYIMARRNSNLKFEPNAYLKQYLTSQITTEATTSSREVVIVKLDASTMPIFSPGTVTRFAIESLNSDQRSQRFVNAIVDSFNEHGRIVQIDVFCNLCAKTSIYIKHGFTNEEATYFSAFFKGILEETVKFSLSESVIDSAASRLPTELRWVFPLFKLMIQSISHRIGSHEILKISARIFSEVEDEKKAYENKIFGELLASDVDLNNLSSISSIILNDIPSGIVGITREDIARSPMFIAISRGFDEFRSIAQVGKVIDVKMIGMIATLNPYVCSAILNKLRSFINNSFIFEDITSVLSEMSIVSDSYEIFDIEGKVCVLIEDDLIDSLVALGDISLKMSGISAHFERATSFKTSIDRTRRGDDMFDAFFELESSTFDEAEDEASIMNYVSNFLRYENINEFRIPEISNISIESVATERSSRIIRFFLPFNVDGGNLVVMKTSVSFEGSKVSLRTKACYVIICGSSDDSDENTLNNLFLENILHISNADDSILTLLSGSTAVKSFQFFPDSSAKVYLIHNSLISHDAEFGLDLNSKRYLMPYHSFDIYAQMISSKIDGEFALLESNRIKSRAILKNVDDAAPILRRVDECEFTPVSVVELYQSKISQPDHDKLVVVYPDGIATKDYGVSSYNTSTVIPFSSDRSILGMKAFDKTNAFDFSKLLKDDFFEGMTIFEIEEFFSTNGTPMETFSSSTDEKISDIDRTIRGELQMKYNINFALENLSHKSKTIQSVTYSSDNFIRWMSVSNDKSTLAVATDNDVEIYFLSGDQYRHISSLYHDDVSSIVFGGSLAITICNRGSNQCAKLWVLATGKTIDIDLPIYRFIKDDVVSGEIITGDQVAKEINVKLTNVKYTSGTPSVPVYYVRNNILHNVIGNVDFNKFFFSESGRYLAYNHKTDTRILDLVTLSPVEIVLSGGSRGLVSLEMIVDGKWTTKSEKEIFVGVGRSSPKKIMFVTPSDATVSYVAMTGDLPTIVSTPSLTIDYEHSDPLVTSVSNKVDLYSSIQGFWIFGVFVEPVISGDKLSVTFYKDDKSCTRKFKLLTSKHDVENVYSVDESGFTITNLTEFKMSFIEELSVSFVDESVVVSKFGIKGRNIFSKNWVDSSVDLPMLKESDGIYIVNINTLEYASIGYKEIDGRNKTFITRFGPSGRVDYSIDALVALITLENEGILELCLISFEDGKNLSILRKNNEIFGSNPNETIKDLFEIKTDPPASLIQNDVLVYNRIAKTSYSVKTTMDTSLDEYPISSKLNLNRFERFQIKELDAIQPQSEGEPLVFRKKGNLALIIQGDTLRILPAKVQFPDDTIKSSDIIPLDIQDDYGSTPIEDFKAKCEKLKIVTRALLDTYPELAENDVTRTAIYRITIGSGVEMAGSTHGDLKTFMRNVISDTPNPNKIIRDDPRISLITNIKYKTIMVGFLRGLDVNSLSFEAYKRNDDESVIALQSILPEIVLPSRKIFEAIKVFSNISNKFVTKGIPTKDINAYRINAMTEALQLEETEVFIDARELFRVRQFFVKSDGTTSLNTDYMLTFGGIKNQVFGYLVRSMRAMQSLLSDDSKYELYRDKTIRTLRDEMRNQMIRFYGLSEDFITCGGITKKSMASFALKVEEPLLYRDNINAKSVIVELENLEQTLRTHLKFNDPTLSGVSYTYYELEDLCERGGFNTGKYEMYLKQLEHEIDTIVEIRNENLVRGGAITNMSDRLYENNRKYRNIEDSISMKRQKRDSAYTLLKTEKLNSYLPEKFKNLPSSLNAADIAIRNLYDLKFSKTEGSKSKYAAIYSFYNSYMKEEEERLRISRRAIPSGFDMACFSASVSRCVDPKNTDVYDIGNDTDFESIDGFFDSVIDKFLSTVQFAISNELSDDIYTGDLDNESSADTLSALHTLHSLRNNIKDILAEINDINYLSRLKQECEATKGEIERFSRFLDQKGMDFSQIIMSACVQSGEESFENVTDRIKILTSVNFEDPATGAGFSTTGVNEDILRKIQGLKANANVEQIEISAEFDNSKKSGKKEIVTKTKTIESYQIPKYIFSTICDSDERVYRMHRDAFRVIHARDVFASFKAKCQKDLVEGVIRFKSKDGKIIPYLSDKIKTRLREIVSFTYVKDFAGRNVNYYKNLIEQEFLFDILKVLDDVSSKRVLEDTLSPSDEKMAENFDGIIEFLDNIVAISLSDPISKIARDTKFVGIEEIEDLLTQHISDELRDELGWLIDYLRNGSRKGKYDLGITVSDFEVEVVDTLIKYIASIIRTAKQNDEILNLETLQAVVKNISTFVIIPEEQRLQLQDLRVIEIYNHYCTLKELLAEHSELTFEYNNVPLSVYFKTTFDTGFDECDMLEWYVENGHNKSVRRDLPDVFYRYHTPSIEKSVSYALFKIKQHQYLSFSTPSNEYKKMEAILKPIMHNYRNGFHECSSTFVNEICLKFPKLIKFKPRNTRDRDEDELGDIELEYHNPEEQSYGLTVSQSFSINLASIIRSNSYKDVVLFIDNLKRSHEYLTVDNSMYIGTIVNTPGSTIGSIIAKRSISSVINDLESTFETFDRFTDGTVILKGKYGRVIDVTDEYRSGHVKSLMHTEGKLRKCIFGNFRVNTSKKYVKKTIGIMFGERLVRMTVTAKKTYVSELPGFIVGNEDFGYSNLHLVSEPVIVKDTQGIRDLVVKGKSDRTHVLRICNVKGEGNKKEGLLHFRQITDGKRSMILTSAFPENSEVEVNDSKLHFYKMVERDERQGSSTIRVREKVTLSELNLVNIQTAKTVPELSYDLFKNAEYDEPSIFIEDKYTVIVTHYIAKGEVTEKITTKTHQVNDRQGNRRTVTDTFFGGQIEDKSFRGSVIKIVSIDKGISKTFLNWVLPSLTVKSVGFTPPIDDYRGSLRILGTTKSSKGTKLRLGIIYLTENNTKSIVINSFDSEAKIENPFYDKVSFVKMSGGINEFCVISGERKGVVSSSVFIWHDIVFQREVSGEIIGLNTARSSNYAAIQFKGRTEIWNKNCEKIEEYDGEASWI